MVRGSFGWGSARGGDAIQDDGEILAGDGVDRQLAAGGVPTDADPHPVAPEAVGELDVEVGSEAAIGDAGVQHVVPEPAELGESLADVAEAGLVGQPAGLGLVDGNRRVVLIDGLEGRYDDRLEGAAW